jgi:hypothetical protein
MSDQLRDPLKFAAWAAMWLLILALEHDLKEVDAGS